MVEKAQIQRSPLGIDKTEFGAFSECQIFSEIHREMRRVKRRNIHSGVVVFIDDGFRSDYIRPIRLEQASLYACAVGRVYVFLGSVPDKCIVYAEPAVADVGTHTCNAQCHFIECIVRFD